MTMSTLCQATYWSSIGTFDLDQFNSNSQLVKYLSQFTVDVVYDSENSQTGEGSYCVYESAINHIDVEGHLVTVVLQFSFSGTQDFCNESDLTQVWKELSATVGINLGQLIRK